MIDQAWRVITTCSVLTNFLQTLEGLERLYREKQGSVPNLFVKSTNSEKTLSVVRCMT